MLAKAGPHLRAPTFAIALTVFALSTIVVAPLLASAQEVTPDPTPDPSVEQAIDQAQEIINLNNEILGDSGISNNELQSLNQQMGAATYSGSIQFQQAITGTGTGPASASISTTDTSAVILLLLSTNCTTAPDWDCFPTATAAGNVMVGHGGIGNTGGNTSKFFTYGTVSEGSNLIEWQTSRSTVTYRYVILAFTGITGNVVLVNPFYSYMTSGQDLSVTTVAPLSTLALIYNGVGVASRTVTYSSSQTSIFSYNTTGYSINFVTMPVDANTIFTSKATGSGIFAMNALFFLTPDESYSTTVSTVTEIEYQTEYVQENASTVEALVTLHEDASYFFDLLLFLFDLFCTIGGFLLGFRIAKKYI